VSARTVTELAAELATAREDISLLITYAGRLHDDLGEVRDAICHLAAIVGGQPRPAPASGRPALRLVRGDR
jgi:nucleoside-diphosphate-sugar epimerase